MVKNIRFGIRIFLYLVISLAIGIAIYLFNAKVILGNAMPTPFGYGIGVVVSGSMEPELSIDDVIIVRKTDDYIVGDVVVYQHRNVLVVHEIISVEKEYVVTKGIANDIDDGPIKISEIKGEVIKVYEGAGSTINFLQSPSGAILIISLALLLLILSCQSEKKEEQKEINKLKEEINKLKNSNE